MGLDCSHDAWHGAYSAFSRWRNEIANAAGYAVWPVKYPDGVTWDRIMLDWGHVPEGALFGEWDETPSDPLIVLFTHSDCEGVIHPDQAGPLADALEALLSELDEDLGGHIGNIRTKTETFIRGLRKAVEQGEDLDFH